MTVLSQDIGDGRCTATRIVQSSYTDGHRTGWRYLVVPDDGRTTSTSLTVLPTAQFPPVPTRFADGSLALLLGNQLAVSLDGGRTWHGQGALPSALR